MHPHHTRPPPPAAAHHAGARGSRPARARRLGRRNNRSRLPPRADGGGGGGHGGGRGRRCVLACVNPACPSTSCRPPQPPHALPCTCARSPASAFICTHVRNVHACMPGGRGRGTCLLSPHSPSHPEEPPHALPCACCTCALHLHLHLRPAPCAHMCVPCVPGGCGRRCVLACSCAAAWCATTLWAVVHTLIPCSCHRSQLQAPTCRTYKI